MGETFNTLPAATLDPIMLANAAWPEFKRMHADPINTTVGVLVDPVTGSTWRPQSVLEARRNALKSIDDAAHYEYQSPQGHLGFLSEAERFVFGDEKPGDDITAYQALGGTGALSLTNEVLGTLLKVDEDGKRALLLDPGWPNHPAIFQRNFDIATYQHRGPGDQYDNFAALEAIAGQPYDSTVLFQVSGYNDDGLDRTKGQWDSALELAKEKGMTVILDAAYIGLTGNSVEDDTYPIRKARELGLLSFVNVSMSKNMGLYNERLGAMFVVNAEQHLGTEQARNLDQAIKKTVRRIVSNPPLLVAEAAYKALGATTNGDVNYRTELDNAAQQLQANRQHFADAVGHRLPIVSNGRGLFTKLLTEGFSDAQQESLRQAGILVLPNSRVNIGGIRTSHVERVGLAVLKALDVVDSPSD